jgi:hypothetical protein
MSLRQAPSIINHHVGILDKVKSRLRKAKQHPMGLLHARFVSHKNLLSSIPGIALYSTKQNTLHCLLLYLYTLK